MITAVLFLLCQKARIDPFPNLQEAMFRSSMTLIYSAFCNIPTVTIHVLFTHCRYPVTEYVLFSTQTCVNLSMDEANHHLPASYRGSQTLDAG
jgi:hypothetical protein